MHTPPDFRSEDTPEGHICFDAIRQGARAPYVVRDLEESSYVDTDPNVARYGLQTYVGHAVLRGDEAVGSLCVVYQRDVRPSDENLRILGAIASALGLEEDRREAEEALRTSRARLLELERVERLDALGTVAGGIAHDFNNLLMGVFANMEMAKDDLPEGHEAALFLGEADRALESARRLTGQLLTFAKGGNPIVETVDMGELVRKEDPVMADYGEYGFSGSLAKPFQIEELSAEMSRVMGVA